MQSNALRFLACGWACAVIGACGASHSVDTPSDAGPDAPPAIPPDAPPTIPGEGGAGSCEWTDVGGRRELTCVGGPCPFDCCTGGLLATCWIGQGYECAVAAATDCGDGTCVSPGGVCPDAGGALLYERCLDRTDCDPAADGCYEVDTSTGTGAMCSVQCLDASDCLAVRGGVGATCYTLYGDPSGVAICYEQCDFDADCAFGLGCVDALDPSGVVIDRICVPND